MPKKTIGSVPVSMRALIQRINRKLAKDNECLKKCREKWRGELGDYFVLDTFRNAVMTKHVEPENFARTIGVLQPWEIIADDA